MKLARNRTGRSQTAERQRRDRAGAAVLRTLYPRFATVRLEFDFRDAGPFTPVPQVTVLYPAAQAYFVFPCPYSHCDGEFDLSTVIQTMARAERTRCDGELQCTGHRMPDGVGQARCDLRLAYQVLAERTEG